MYVETIRSVITMAFFGILAYYASLILIETVKLQPDNFSIKHGYEFQRLISIGFQAKSTIVDRLYSDSFILLVQLEFILAIATAGILFDHLMVDTRGTALPENQTFFYYFGVLTASGSDGEPVLGSELWKLSYGYALAVGVALAFGLLFYFERGTRFIQNIFIPMFQIKATFVLMILIIIAANPAKKADITEPHDAATWLQKLAMTGIFAL